MRDTTTGKLPFAMQPRQDMRWFCRTGYVHHRPECVEVFMGGMLIGSYLPTERGMRNVLLCVLSSDEQIRKTRLASAFGVSRETVRLIEKQARHEGLAAVYGRRQRGRTSVVTPALQRRLERLFEDGATTRQAHAKVKRHMSHGTVRRVYRRWKQEKAAAKDRSEDVCSADAGSEPHGSVQRSLFEAAETRKERAPQDRGPDQDVVAVPADAVAPTPNRERPTTSEENREQIAPSEPSTFTSDEVADNDAAETDDEGDPKPPAIVAASEIRGGKSIQHIGSWLLIAMTAQLGLHAAATRYWKSSTGKRALRLAIDAVVTALAIGQKCVEGVRRVATPTADVLLRADGAPSASWVRRLLKRFVNVGGATWFHLAMAGQYVRRARQAEADANNEVVVFYIDNHLRPYAGKHTVRWSWRMQDKRVVPGAATDYYVHDEDGYPVLRIDIPSHGSLTEQLTPTARLLRAGVGDDIELLLVFDRAGAYPTQLAELRDNDFGFVTYERRPYPLRMATELDRTIEIDGEQYQWCETRHKNLGNQRGRVRRISLRTPDGAQLNLLAVSEQPAERLIIAMLGDADGDGGRWNQENGFKHGVERWGINQLDGRKVERYDPKMVIPNPARRRLDRRLKLARIREGLARRALARLPDGSPRRQRFEQDLQEAIDEQADLEAQRPHTPSRAPLDETELADKLVRHEPNYKTVLDTIRIACANAEADLAAELARHLPRPAEAKKALATLFAAPGDVRVASDALRICLRPPGSAAELDAFRRFFVTVNSWRLTLPDDPRARALWFECQIS